MKDEFLMKTSVPSLDGSRFASSSSLMPAVVAPVAAPASLAARNLASRFASALPEESLVVDDRSQISPLRWLKTSSSTVSKNCRCRSATSRCVAWSATASKPDSEPHDPRPEPRSPVCSDLPPSSFLVCEPPAFGSPPDQGDYRKPPSTIFVAESGRLRRFGLPPLFPVPRKNIP